MLKNVKTPLLCLIFLLLCLITTSLVQYLNHQPFFRHYPGIQMALTTKSLWHDKTLVRKDFQTIHKNVLNQSKATNKKLMEDAFSITRNGKFYPKHSILYSFLMVPFYVIFNDLGFWLFNQLTLILLLTMVYLINKNFFTNDKPFLYLLIALIGTQILYFSYGVYYDLFATALIFTSLHLYCKKKVIVASVILGLVPLIKISNIVLIPFLIIAVFDFKTIWKEKMNLLIGLAPPLICLLVSNHLIWGSAFHTAYDRLPIYHKGTYIIGNAGHFLDLKLLFINMYEKLLGKQFGLFRFNPILILLPFSLWFLRNHPQRRFLYLFSLAGLVNILMFFQYSYFNATFYGNRFVFPAIFFLLVPIMTSIFDYRPFWDFIYKIKIRLK